MKTKETEIQEYLKKIKSIDTNSASEHSYRTALENLIESLQFESENIILVQEARDKTLGIDGTPDFSIYRDSKSLIGFVECKKITADLETIKQSKQIQKYSETIKNIIITNYRQFMLLQDGKIKSQASLLENNLEISEDPNSKQNLINLLMNFYNYDYPYIKTKKELVNALAKQSFYYSVELKKYMSNTGNEGNFYYKFNELFKNFQDSMQYRYDIADFCDVYAQSLVYGLLLSRLATRTEFDEIGLDYLSGMPLEYKLLYEFLSAGYGESKYLPGVIVLALKNIAKNINLINIVKINDEFEKEGKGENGIAVYLYEDFLKEYDKLKGTEERKKSGVYYTPKEVTHFITKSIEEIIKTKFNKSDGYLDKDVKVLDFACGTGTFINSVYELMLCKNKSPLEKRWAKQKIIKDIYGFELLFTPYIVAHTVLTKYLKDNDIEMTEKERLPIYLTNTLDFSSHLINKLLPNLLQEHENALKVKTEKDILAIIGNPPYFSGTSKAEKGKIDTLLNDYKKGLNEKRISLSDLYIKFIRFAQQKIENRGYGVVGIITNNSWLNGITHRQMRKSLMQTYILNLHGNARKGETDKNIFDIMVGVSISIFIKHQSVYDIPKYCNGNLLLKKVFYYSVLADNIITRNEKLNFLETKTLSSIKYEKLNPQKTENYFFVPQDLKEENIYKNFFKITNIFDNYNSGVGTGNDRIVIHYREKDLLDLKKDFSIVNDENLRKKYKITDKTNWKLKEAREDLIENYNQRLIQYRIFDFRFSSLSKKSTAFMGRPRYRTMKHFDGKNNIGLCFTRVFNADTDIYNRVFISRNIIDHHLHSDAAYIAPLFVYNYNMGQETEAQTPNFTKKFYKEYLDTLSFKPVPEDILNYIYAVLHCPKYRKTYIEFLKTDFPSVPMTKKEKIFYNYAAIGKRLIELHTMQNVPKDEEIREEFKFKGDIGNFLVSKILQPTETEHRLSVISTEGKEVIFNGVTKNIYDFEIGYRKPIGRWLKYRKDESIILNTEDLCHIKDMIIVIKHTMLIMEQINALDMQYLN
jgi:predicted helicase